MNRSIIVYCLSLLSIAVSGQSVLMLPEAINIAMKNSLDIQLASNVVEANHILNHIGVAGGLPAITGNLSNTEAVSSINQKLSTGQTIDRNAAATNNSGANIAVSMLLFNGNRVVATKQRLAEIEKQSQELLNSQVQNILGAVTTAYYDIVRQQSYLKTIERSIDASRQQLVIVQTSQQVGMANNADLFQAQIDLNALLQAAISQQLIIEQAKTELLRLLTLKPDSVISIVDTIIVDRSLNLAQLLDSLQKNPDIIASGNQVKINELIVKETAALRYPAIRAATGYNFNRNKAAAGNLLLNQNYGPNVGLSVGIPIFSGSSYKRQQRVAEIDVRNAELSRQLLTRDYGAAVVKNYQSYASTLKQLESEQRNYELSQQLLDLALKRFQYRQATIVDVKNAQQSFEESGYRLVNLSFAAKSAEIELKRLGNLLKL